MGQRFERFKTNIRDVEKIKDHVKENKKNYITGAICFGVGVGTALLVGRRTELRQVIDSYKLQINSPTTNNVVATLERRGHPGNIVQCNETGEVVASQRRAAELLGLNAPEIVRHLQGTKSDVNGLTFTKIAEAR